jgi:hypothetical protein
MHYNFGPIDRTLRVTAAMEAGSPIMSGVLKKSLASWRDAHGFSILCILNPDGERFVMVPSSADAPDARQGAPPWPGMSEAALRAHLAKKGLSETDVDEAVELSREWATTITGSGSALWPLSDWN